MHTTHHSPHIVRLFVFHIPSVQHYSTTTATMVEASLTPLKAVQLLLITVISAVVQSCQPPERAALLAFKAALREPHDGRIFNSWTGSNCCHDWLGVMCDQNTGRVADINLRAGSIYTTMEKPHRAGYMTGHISPEICKLTRLSSIVLTDWQEISGEIPSCISSLSFLRIIDLTGNRISGALPADIGKLKQLTLLSAADNLIAGTIPASLANVTGLMHLDLRNNRISGPIPKYLGWLRVLSRAFLSGNQISGPIPGSICKIYRLVDLDLSGNKLSGPIPESLGRMANLATLNLGNNKLSGRVPASLLGSGISELSLGHNLLEGIIPDGFGPRSYFTILDLSYNNIKGPIPKSISSVLYIGYLDFSHNHMCGPIPNASVFDNMDASSFEYNDCLCGKPLKPC